ncbi:uncharacterized protein N7483_005134 [Penicillium malachiteum]|uniref:uncharacterized protein n=1 Tax=Penicillium malachiteum TaxID=1324776 RepID=UPI0025484045|nr:uncharacterized protein N7483_005134 [Penicillium malachiteum]KAJ5730626.1 hypothetical protein N7483_005134 [Penicillium malachiteum]
MAVPGILQRSLDKANLTTETKFWPGGVPSFIKSPTENFTVKPWEFPPIANGWYRFIRENWVSGDDATDDSKAQQRRALIETWVTAKQHFRDSYTNKTLESEKRFSRETYALGVISYCARPKTVKKMGTLAEILLMFYDYNRMWGHIAKETFTITLKENDPATIDNINRYQALETANFGILAFNNAGEALYDPYHPSPILVDDFALNTGLVLVVLSYNNGKPYQGYRMLALNFFSISMTFVGMGRPLEDLIQSYGHDPDPNDERIYFCFEPLDMEKPLSEILLAEPEDQVVEDEEVEEALTELVPGYVEAEAAGNGLAKDFDLFGSEFNIY